MRKGRPSFLNSNVLRSVEETIPFVERKNQRVTLSPDSDWLSDFMIFDTEPPLQMDSTFPSSYIFWIPLFVPATMNAFIPLFSFLREDTG